MSKYPQEEIKPYEGREDKHIQVERMFDNIAPTYDNLNHTLSWGVDRIWRRTAIKTLTGGHARDILDVATGTGDFAIEIARKIKDAKITAVDISEGMMKIGREKTRKAGLDKRIIFQKEDCTHLTIAENQFDAITVAFGVRNFEDLDKGLREMRRVLRQGGQVVILELSEPEHFPMKQLYHFYSSVIIPFIGRLKSKDNGAYDYLPRSIRAFLPGEEMLKVMQKAGFRNARLRRLSFGMCTLYTAQK